MALDVLGFCPNHAGNDDLYLVRNTARCCTEKRRSCAEFRRVFIPESGIGPDFCCSSARAAARLVALRRVQWLVLVGISLTTVFADKAFARTQPTCGATLSGKVEHRVAGLPAVLVSLHSLYNHHPYPRVAGHSRSRSRPDWTCDPLERCSAATRRVCRRATAAPQPGSSHSFGGRLDLHSRFSRVECSL